MAAPGTLLNQGRVLDPAGGAVNGEREVVLSLYTQPSGGSYACTESQTVMLTNGYYTAVLGDNGCDLGALDLQGTTYWLATRVGTTDLLPRTELHASPMSLSASGGTGGSGTVPQLTNTERDALASVEPGQIIFNTTLRELQTWTGFDWVRLGADASATSAERVFVGWGRNSTGELGIGSTSGTNAYPMELQDTLPVATMSAGGYHHGGEGATCIVTESNDLYCSGKQHFVPDGTTTNRTSFSRGGIGLEWRDVYVGKGLVACGITTDDTAYCWGHQQYGAVGNGQHVNATASSPQPVVGGISWKELRPGGRYNGSFHFAFLCGVSTATTGDNGYCWGRDDYGVLGNGSGAGEHNYTTPASGILSGFTWKTIEPGTYHVCGITTQGQTYCWGEGGSYRLGNGSTTDMDVPTLVSGGHTFASITLGHQFTCALTPDGEAWCWGDNPYGQLGDGSTSDATTPRRVLGGRRFLEIDAGQHHVCGIDTAHQMWCWGYNGNGGIGIGNTSNVQVPTLVYGEYRFSDVELGYRHSLGITQ